nr:GNAT family N-acetyltransferase [Roseomonas rosulenta]
MVALHQRLAREATAEGFAFALDLSGLRVPGIRFFSAWEGEALLGVGALKRLSPDHGEVKSMHTAQAARRRGVGAAMLRHILDQARAMGLARVSLETGTSAYFAGAVAMYLREGFADCPPFGDYTASSENRFLALQL